MWKDKALSDKEMLYVLAGIKGLGNKGIEKLCKEVSPLSRLLELSAKEICACSGLHSAQAEQMLLSFRQLSERMQSYGLLQERGISFITCLDAEYPEELRGIENRPTCVYVLGKLWEKKREMPLAAVVGARNPGNYGQEMCRFLCRQLAEAGVGIVSGMARGIDAIAHRTAMDCGVPSYAVLGCGVNICYPRENMDIYEHIKRGGQGAVLSEYAPHIPPLAAHFPPRNRIISALADVVLVIEAGEHSGSLITASYAAEQGKEVYVVPGRFTDRLSRGGNRLIADGAFILTSAEEILEALLPEGVKKAAFIEKNDNTLEKNEKMVYSCLDFSPKYLEDIIQETGLDCATVISAVLNLEMRGLVKQISGNYYSKSCM